MEQLNLYLEKTKKREFSYSVFYEVYKDRIESHGYSEMEIPFKYEFLFFEDRYIAILEHMIKNNLKPDCIVDIGCQLGFQSEIFRHFTPKYIGIDYSEANFFNKEKVNVEYIVGRYPFQLEGSPIVISSMSLGYFEPPNQPIEEYENDIVNSFIRDNIKHIYIATNKSLLNKLEKYYTLEHIEEDRYGSKHEVCERNVFNNLFYLRLKEQ